VSGRVTGKVALVTGAGSGIGRAVAIRLAEEGARVVVTSRTEAHVRETCALIGDDAVGCVLDLRDRESIDGAVARVTDAYARLDVLVCVAGVDQPSEPPVAETTDEEWEEVFAVNVTGVFRLCRAVLPILPESASIVTIGSANGIAPRPNAAAYCASKAALLMFTRALALELAPRGIRANCVCPGVVDTPLTDLFLGMADDPAALREEYAAANPLRRIADAREVANCVLFLASDEASFVTASPFVVDGGQLAW
jgi:NAD(P)-dependent dehydrogenase (short-subunit alcohol dehydrogenase family)